ncbi:MAG: hypothetical protein JXR96_17760 [Deltaproteobacteria bacterium]|nr:hypothetical protein [Deltaproteobacteria bacterium]
MRRLRVLVILASTLCCSVCFGADDPESADAQLDLKPKASGCMKDADCEGDQICVDSMCLAPRKKQAGEKELDSFMLLFTSGPIFENSYGGIGFSLSLALGGRGHYFTTGLHLRAGARWEDEDPKWEPGVELGYRYLIRLSSGMILQFALTVGYNHLFQADVQNNDVYDWDVPFARLGGGVLWDAGGLKMGFDVSYFTGYAFHTDAYDNRWKQIWEWKYDGGHIHYMLVF